MAARKRELATVSAAPQLDQQYEMLIDNIAGAFAPFIQDGFRRAMVRGVGIALAGAGEVANGALLAQAAGPAASDYTPGTVLDGTKCKIRGCPNPTRCKGLCSKHYQVARRRAVKRTGKVARPQHAVHPRRPGNKKKTTTSRKAPRAARPGKTAAKPAAPESKAAA